MSTLPMPVPGQPTATLSRDQSDAVRAGNAMTWGENNKDNRLQTQDEDPRPVGVIWIYNILEMAHDVWQPPLFPHLVIPACEPGAKFAYTMIPAYVKEPYERAGDTEKYYKRVDGRKCATSLLNPDVHPNNPWASQLIRRWTQGTNNRECSNANLNAYGVFWSTTPPTDTAKLDSEIRQFRAYAEETLNALTQKGDQLHAANDDKSISPYMHFAMDYFQRQAPWHTSHQHFISCPNCGDRIKEGIAYHTTLQGDRCVLDPERYAKIIVSRAVPVPVATAPAPVVEPPAPAVPAEEMQLDDMNQEQLLALLERASAAMSILEARGAKAAEAKDAEEAKDSPAKKESKSRTGKQSSSR